MPDVLPSQLANAVLGKLYDVLTNGDDSVPASEDNFFSWCTPGIPVDAADFDFLSQGLTGVVKTAALDALRSTEAGGDGQATTQPELTPALLDQLRAQDTARLYMQAENFARLVDFIPDVTKANNGQFTRFAVQNNEGTLSEVYTRVLRMSQVMESQLSQEVKDKIARFRKLLTVTVKKKDLITDAEIEVAEPSPLTRQYNDKLAAYMDAALEYNTRRIDGMTADDPRSVHFWAINAGILRNKVKAALNDWVSNGFKNDYEQIAAFIDQVMQRDLTLLKQEYRDELERARLTGTASGSDFFSTSLVPGNFAKSLGWTGFTFKSTDFASRSGSTSMNKRWQVQGGGGFLGIFGGQASHGRTESHQELHASFDSDRFELSFEMCQVPIVRPWFKPSFLNSKTWRFDQGSPEVRDERLSDGANPPRGLMPAYPTAIVFVRDLKLGLGHSEGFSNFVRDQKNSSTGGGGYLSFGPFFLGGSASSLSSNGSTQRDWGFHGDEQGMVVPGMQIAGFKCHILPKSPDPLAGAASWV